MRSIPATIFLIICLVEVTPAADLERLLTELDGPQAASALLRLEEAANAGDAHAMTLLATRYQSGEGVEKDLPRAFDLYQQAAELGDAEAQFNLGNMYLLGEGTAADEEWALTYYRQAAGQGHELAQRNMLQLYRAAGLDPPQSPHAAPETVERLATPHTQAEPGVAEVEAVVAQPLAPTTRLPADAERAAAAVSPSDAPALAVAETEPEIVPDGASEAVADTLQSPASAIDPPGGAAENHAPGSPGPVLDAYVEQAAAMLSDDERQAIRLAEQHGVKVAVAGDRMVPSPASDHAPPEEMPAAPQQSDERGNDTPVSVEDLAIQGDAAAQYEMARMRLAGEGGTHDVEGAMVWLERAADAGHSDAQFDLGTRYLTGVGVKPDDAMAITLLREAARNGHAEARQRLKSIYAEAGLPMPDFERPRQQLKPAVVGTHGAGKAPTLRHADPAVSQPASPSQITGPGDAAIADELESTSERTPAVSPGAGPGSARSHDGSGAVTIAGDDNVKAPAEHADPEPTPAYQPRRYAYPVIDHDATPLRKVEAAEIDPQPPADHLAVAGDTLADTRPQPITEPVEPYRERRYIYAVVDHDAAPLRRVRPGEVEPPRPENHEVIPGSVLLQPRLARSPVAATESPEFGLTDSEMAAEPTADALAGTSEPQISAPERVVGAASFATTARDSESGPGNGVLAAGPAPDAPAELYTPVRAEVVESPATDVPDPAPAISSGEVAAGRDLETLSEAPGADQHPPATDRGKTTVLADAVAGAATPAAGGAQVGADVGVATAVVTAAAAVPTGPEKRGFFDKLRGALGGGEKPGDDFISRAPGSEPVVGRTPASASNADATHSGDRSSATNEYGSSRDEDVKLVIAARAEPAPIIDKPSLEQAKAALSAGEYASAARQFTILARDGDSEAQAHIGYMTYQGEGVERDKAAAVDWYRRAAVQGNRDAQYNLAVAYAFGEGVPQDDAEAVVWYRRAAEQGSAIAQYSLGVSYALGEGVEQADADAAHWYRAAAEQGYPAAQYNLAYMYRAGSGLEASNTQALHWFIQAARNGHASAQYSLGYMYRSGKGVQRDIDEAIRWYRLAADQGHPEARADLSSLAPDG